MGARKTSRSNSGGGAYVYPWGTGLSERIGDGPGYASPQAARDAGVYYVAQNPDTGQYQEVRQKASSDFVYEGEFPDEVFDLYGSLEFQTIPGVEPLDPIVQARRAMEYNEQVYPRIAAQATLYGILQSGATNRFTFDQFDRYLEDVTPGFRDLQAKQTDQVQSFLRGEVPADVQELVAIRSAEAARNAGVGLGGRAANISARDLGLTSTDLVDRGIQFSEQIQARTQDVTARLLAPTADMIANNQGLLASGSMVTPSYVASVEQQNQANQLAVQQFNATGTFQADAARVQGLASAYLAEADMENTYNQRLLDADYRDWSKHMAEREADSGLGGLLGTVAGGIAGSLFGMPTIGATLGGALGGAADGGGVGALTGGLTGAAAGTVFGNLTAELGKTGVTSWLGSLFGRTPAATTAGSASSGLLSLNPSVMSSNIGSYTTPSSLRLGGFDLDALLGPSQFGEFGVGSIRSGAGASGAASRIGPSPFNVRL